LKARGTTVVLITHKVNILAIADKILVMAGGAVQAYGPRDEILGKLMGPRVVPPTTAPVSTGDAAATTPPGGPSRLLTHISPMAS
jgi:ABC-type protease/lipase transport system fused ATPase/permease subunit